MAVVDGEVGICVRGLVCSWELDGWAWRASATVLDLDLQARDVVLWLVDVGAVDTCKCLLAAGNER